MTEIRQPTEDEWKDAATRLEEAFHEVVMKEFQALQAAGFSPYNFRFCGLGAHIMAMGRLIGSNPDAADRRLMFEYISGDGMEMVHDVATAVAARLELINARPN